MFWDEVYAGMDHTDLLIAIGRFVMIALLVVKHFKYFI